MYYDDRDDDIDEYHKDINLIYLILFTISCLVLVIIII